MKTQRIYKVASCLFIELEKKQKSRQNSSNTDSGTLTKPMQWYKMFVSNEISHLPIDRFTKNVMLF